MYEQFTDRARKVLQLANQEAQHLNHESIAPEHILLGLVKEGTGVAAKLFMNLRVSLQKIRLEVEKIAPAGPQVMSPGKLPYAPETMQVIENAIEEANKLQHNFVGTEHLLLALLREQAGVVAQALTNLGLNRQDVHWQLLAFIENGPPPARPEAVSGIEVWGIKEFSDVVSATLLAVVGGAMGGEMASRLYPTLHNLVFWLMLAIYLLVYTILVFPMTRRKRPLGPAIMWLSSGFMIGTFGMWSPDGVNPAVAGALSGGLTILALAAAMWSHWAIGERPTTLFGLGLVGAVLGFGVAGATAVIIGVTLASIPPLTVLVLAGLLGVCPGAYIGWRLANRILVLSTKNPGARGP
jgi:hypothetical protein